MSRPGVIIWVLTNKFQELVGKAYRYLITLTQNEFALPCSAGTTLFPLFSKSHYFSLWLIICSKGDQVLLKSNKYLRYPESFGRAFPRWLFHVVQGLKVDQYFLVNLQFSSNNKANLRQISMKMTWSVILTVSIIGIARSRLFHVVQKVQFFPFLDSRNVVPKKSSNRVNLPLYLPNNVT